MEQLRAVSLFDFDGTMLKGDSIVEYISLAIKEGLCPKRNIPKILLSTLLALSGAISTERAKSMSLSFLKNVDKNRQEEFAKRFISEKLLPRLYPEAFDRLLMHRAKGDMVLIVSASPDCYMKHLPLYLPVDGVLASLTTDSGEVTCNFKGAEKPKRIEKWLKENNIAMDIENSFAYGDSSHDIPMMELTQNPICINPKKALSRAKPDWKMEYWGENGNKIKNNGG
ncbi:MAG: HAD-IB family hydrolase [Christensenellaceae bacterium]|nr:HAD-IB family hydrolase [Christensenellaceae bacterium]